MLLGKKPGSCPMWSQAQSPALPINAVYEPLGGVCVVVGTDCERSFFLLPNPGLSLSLSLWCRPWAEEGLSWSLHPEMWQT